MKDLKDFTHKVKSTYIFKYQYLCSVATNEGGNGKDIVEDIKSSGRCLSELYKIIKENYVKLGVKKITVKTLLTQILT